MRLLKVINYLCFGTILGLLIVLFNVASDIYPGAKTYPNHAHITLYLDRNFDDVEVENIIKAAWSWSAATHNIIEYDVIQLPTKQKIDTDNSVIIVKTSPDDPQIMLMDFTGGNKTLGVYHPGLMPSISIVSERLSDDTYKEVIMHELGHSLGLEHLEGLGNMDTLMYPYTNVKIDEDVTLPAGSDHVTYKDLVQFCKLYHCDADKLKN